MEDLNQLKLVLVKKKKTNKWLAEEQGVKQTNRIEMVHQHYSTGLADLETNF